MNTEDFVTYEQALKLKELGFNYDCNHYYITDYENNLQISASYHNHNDNALSCSAPTLAQAQKWLREKGYNIGLRIYKYNWELTICFKFCERPIYNNLYSPYEEALSIGITECIKLLENKHD